LSEIIRQASSGRVETGKAVVRAEDDAKPAKDATSLDTAPVNVGFTFGGLAAAELPPDVLHSFPGVFKDGMAAAAERLGDTGDSAPEGWHGALGGGTLHGQLNFGHVAPADLGESDWERLRDDVEAFNDSGSEYAKRLRRMINGLFIWIGIEILHIELAEDPYLLGPPDDAGNRPMEPLLPRREHFGFVDGISQPYLNLDLEDPAAGGGRPAPGRSWDPVAPGEVLLNLPDEDGGCHAQPSEARLRNGGTYMVFRKLEQDVAGFNAFIASRRDDESGRERLAAEIVGRWKSGASLVRAPLDPGTTGPYDPVEDNDFLYVADDPDGRACPLGAHVRRSNPRDIGGRDEVRRHRILRRSLSYGGRLLTPEEPSDGRARGMLFMALCARIDVQFEVIQSEWLNSGAFLGQTGLRKCPLTGANDGDVSDQFVPAGGGAPVTRMPRFVTTRGGDYFFMPGLEGLKYIVAHRTPTMADATLQRTVAQTLPEDEPMFSERRIGAMARQLIVGQAQRVTPLDVDPNDPRKDEDDAQGAVVFVGRHDHVKRVMSTPAGSAQPLEFSIEPYRRTMRRMTMGHDLVTGTEFGAGPASDVQRMRMLNLMNEAWNGLEIVHGGGVEAKIEAIASRPLERRLRRLVPAGRIDLIQDLAMEAAAEVSEKVFGAPLPGWLSELAVSLPFAKTRIGELYPDWLASLRGEAPERPGLISMQTWSLLQFIDIIGNPALRGELQRLSRAAASEMTSYLEDLLDQARGRRGLGGAPWSTYVEALAALEGPAVAAGGAYEADVEAYRSDSRMILLELVGTVFTAPPLTFGSVSGTLLTLGRSLPAATSGPTPDGIIDRTILETMRLNPTTKLFMRRCVKETELPAERPAECPLHGAASTIAEGDWVAAVTAVASKDPCVFPDPDEFSLGAAAGGPRRDLSDYLLFGAVGGNRECWGRDRVALPLMRACYRAALRLDGLRRVAGPGGEPQTIAGVPVGLPARFRAVRRPG